MKILDYYYLVILRFYDIFKKDRLSYRATGVVAFTFIMNLFSLTLLFTPNILKQDIFWIILIIVGIGIYWVLDVVYNKKRREKLREAYKDESDESRQRGVIAVVSYEALSIVFLIFSFWMIAP